MFTHIPYKPRGIGAGGHGVAETERVEMRRRAGLAGVVLLGVAAVVALAVLAARPGWRPTPPTPPAIAHAGIPAPGFDVVRVDPTGGTVVAGRAAAGATVTILDNGKAVGTATADDAGAFAWVPDAPLKPGPQALTLSEELPNGTVIGGASTAFVDVPAQATGQALAGVSDAGKPSRVLSAGGPQPGTLGIGTVDYDAAGHAIFSGTAPAGARVSLSLNGGAIGSAKAGRDGRWTLTANVPTASGTLSLAQDGGAVAAVTAPFALETLPSAVADGHVVIASGQSLWLIARHVYGHGNLYTLIYQANPGQIRRPDLIFPGQAFTLPQPKG